MAEGYITIAEAARRLNKCEKTIRRMVQHGKLPARYPVPNRAEIAIADIEALSVSRHPVQAENALAERLAQLERKVSKIEAKLAELSAPVQAVHAVQKVRAETERADVPDGAVNVSDFVKAHGMSRDTVKSQIEAGRLDALSFPNPARADEKIRYFTSGQQAEAVALWRYHARFRACPDCPHDT